MAPRVAFFIANGYWPNVCRHKCDKPNCVNAAHLEDGTQQDNVTDIYERGRRQRMKEPRFSAKRSVSDRGMTDRVKATRIENGISQCAVAAALGVSQPSYNLLENGSTRVSLFYLASLATMYGIDVATFIVGYEIQPDELLLARALNLPLADVSGTL